ncbi:MAG: RimK family alpha-L-glutamate ligase, partial [Chromatiales bacterium]|nr:RimK family alpha-L-glutamate ligase [Chromatiales bacterium]
QNPDEDLPPSSRKSLANFVRVGKSLGLEVDLIDRKDFTRLAEYDALFIRETTRIDHHTYRFARKADGEGMVVIDDPDSILKCTNKVYLAELLTAHKVPTPKTVILRKENLLEVEAVIGYPVVLKIPDGSFSRGVFKAESRAELEDIAKRLFKESDLILAQEFVYTEFDWRVGILNKQPFFVCQYFMSKKHWQIVNHASKGGPRHGGFSTLAVENAPPQVVKTALRAANLIGDGLYGVDLKQTPQGVVVIEVNDNPNLDAGVEDQVLGDRLYRHIMEDFVRRLDRKRRR